MPANGDLSGLVRHLRRYSLLVVVVAVGWWLRAGPLLRDGPLSFPVDYDEGVYFGSAALLARGVLPFRDFVFVHPPGWLVLLSPLGGPLAAIVGVEKAFGITRVLVTFIGVGNIVLTWVLMRRIAGPAAAIVAAGLYATYPPLVGVERGPFLEPSLNTLVLTGAILWLGRSREDADHLRPFAAGVAFAAACAVKTWGVFALAGVLASVPIVEWMQTKRAVMRLVLGGVVVAALLLALFVAASPSNFFEQVVVFQLHRAPDGVAGPARLRLLIEPLTIRNLSDLPGATHPVSAIGATIGVVFALIQCWRRRARAERFLLVMLGTMLVAFMVGRSFYLQYEAHLAVPETLLAGYAAGTAWNFLGWRWVRTLRPVLAVGLLLTPVLPARQSILGGRVRSRDLPATAAFVRAEVPKDACLFAFEPAWGLGAGHLPPRVRGGPVISDPYGAMLLPTALSGRSYEGIGSAFEEPISQPQMRRLLERCEWVIYGGRGPAQLSATSEAWFSANFTKRFPSDGQPGFDVWQRVAGGSTSPLP